MTREEAIKILEENKPTVIFEDEDAQKRMADIWNAIEMAIKALEQEPYEKFESVKDHVCKLAGDYKCWDNRLTDDEALELCRILEQEPCEDVISRQAAKKALEDRFMELQKRHSENRYETNFCLNTILELPSVNLQPKTGHWILLDECANSGYYCSECHKKVVKEGWSDTVKKIKYCPNCGAKMESEDQK